MIPEGTTHVWTPALQRPYVGVFFRRAYFQKTSDGWESFGLSEHWYPTNNDNEWFDTEIKEGYLVPLETYQSPEFQAKEEEV